MSGRARRAAPTGAMDLGKRLSEWEPFVPTALFWARARKISAPIAALALSSGALFNGYNSLYGQAVCYLVNALTVVFLLVVYRPGMMFWRRLAPIYLFLGLAALWVTLVNAGVRMVPGMGPPVVYARDLFPAEMLGYLAGVLALLCGMILGQRRQEGRAFILWVVLFNSLWLFCGLMARGLELDDYFPWSLSRQGRFTGTIGNANVTATLAGAMALIAAGELLRAIRSYKGGVPPRLVLWATVLLILLGTMISTASRFVAIVEVPMVLLLLRTQFPRDGSRPPVSRYFAMAGAACAAVLILTGGGLLIDRLPSLFLEGDSRLTMWRHYADLAMASPFYGYGLGSFPSLNNHFLPDAEMAQVIWQVNSAHNILLQLILNGGLPYLVLLLSAAILVGGTILRGLAKGRWQILLVAPALAVGQILLCGMVDIVLDVPATVVVMLALAGTLWSRAAEIVAGESEEESAWVRFTVRR